MYQALDIPEAQQSAFYRHMGHSRNINENIYQAPIAELEVRHIGAVLKKFGNCMTVHLMHADLNSCHQRY